MKNILSLFAVLILLFSCKNNKEVEKTSENQNQNRITLNDAQFKNAGIQTGALQEQILSEKASVTGFIEIPPASIANVSAPFGGYIKSSNWMVGEHIQKGQVLATIENPALVELQEDYLLSKSDLAFAEKDYQRQKELNKMQASSDKVTQKALNTRDNYSIKMRALGEKLRIAGINPNSVSAGNIKRSTTLNSPISGYISKITVNRGQFVSPSDLLFGIVNTADTHLVLRLFEKDLDKIQVGQTVFAYTNQNPSQKYTAQIILISKDFGSDRSVSAQCHFIKYDGNLMPGTFMNAEVETNPTKAFTIPESGTVSFAGQMYIFEEIQPKTYQMVLVKTGNSENGFTEILNPNLADHNKKWVTKGAYSLLSALKNLDEED